jgi:hypothetical protein
MEVFYFEATESVENKQKMHNRKGSQINTQETTFLEFYLFLDFSQLPQQ